MNLALHRHIRSTIGGAWVEHTHADATSEHIALDYEGGHLGEAHRGAKRHPSSERFHSLLDEAKALHDKKQKDYGKDTDPFANVRASEMWGVDGWVGSLMRLNDKVIRLQRFARDGELANESAKDSMLDIVVYAAIAYVLYEESEHEGG